MQICVEQLVKLYANYLFQGHGHYNTIAQHFFCVRIKISYYKHVSLTISIMARLLNVVCSLQEC